MQEACAYAIRMLLENEIDKFPVDLRSIKQYGNHRIIYLTYDQAENIIASNGLKILTETNDALTIYEDNIYCVIYNNKIDYALEQKNIAHELGHIACRHKIKDNIVGKTQIRDCKRLKPIYAPLSYWLQPSYCSRWAYYLLTKYKLLRAFHGNPQKKY